MTRLTEPLHAPMPDVNDDASLLGVVRIHGESEETYRARVAYALAVQMEKPITSRMLLNCAYWALRARLEATGYTVGSLCSYRGSMSALVEKN